MKHSKTLIRLGLCVAIPYGIFGIFLYIVQSSLLYFPSAQDFSMCPGFSDYQTIRMNGTRAYYKPTESQSVIVIYHGNAGSACDRSVYRPLLEQFGASLLFVEYTGYANDTVSPSSARLLRDAEHIHAFLQSQQYTNVVVLGESIGSGPASYHAKLGGVSTVVLLAPFSNLHSLAQVKIPIYPMRLMLSDTFTNKAWLQHFTGSVLIVHGTNDEVIPPRFSEELFTHLTTQQKQYVLLQDVGHNDILASEEFRKALTMFLSQ